MAPDRRQASVLGRRRSLFVGLIGAAAFSWWYLGITWDDVTPTGAGWNTTKAFFERALSPATDHETEFRPSEGFLAMAWRATLNTLFYAAAAMGLALLGGLVLGFLASSAWWADDFEEQRPTVLRRLQRLVGPVIYGTSRVLIAVLRSIHELIWALILLLAFRTADVTAVVAIALPFTGILAKIFSEMIDEAPRTPSRALRMAGASGLQTFVVGLVPPALPDMTAYAFYRFECALRSAAIMGFFGFETLGLRIKESFDYGYYGETWTFLYFLLALIIVFDLWSGAIRRRMVTA